MMRASPQGAAAVYDPCEPSPRENENSHGLFSLRPGLPARIHAGNSLAPPTLAWPDVIQVIDLLIKHPEINIVGETSLRINHNLCALPGTAIKDIKLVMSHPQ
eukprot:363815-Chlamydomonas_euryale.AAC.9